MQEISSDFGGNRVDQGHIVLISGIVSNTYSSSTIHLDVISSRKPLMAS